ncbi:hypothetical protein ABIA24_000892 [Sinorhizobium fredii]|uniref:hypothetical protein n=1 Tax=Rhizobium fredii TaxID=380 RepID=UPI003518A7A3
MEQKIGEDAGGQEVSNDLSLPEPTLYPKFSVQVRGWENDITEEVTEFAQVILAETYDISRYLDLSRLESIVIGADYREALESVNEASAQPTAAPTSNEYGQGAAMARHVMRDDEIWSVVVIWTPLVRQIADKDHELHKFALHIFFHELVHVDDLRLFSRTYPGGWKAAKPRDGRDLYLQSIVNPCQSEYSAQRRSAWVDPEAGFELLNMLEKVLLDVDNQVREERLKYRLHGDMDVLWPIVFERLTFLFQCLGYGLGHADWAINARGDDPERANRYERRLNELAELPSGWLLADCRKAVQPFFEMENWSGMEVFDPLIEVAEKLLNQYGMFTSASGDGIYVDMPYTGLHDL